MSLENRCFFSKLDMLFLDTVSLLSALLQEFCKEFELLEAVCTLVALFWIIQA